jgi:hypothetical protein
MLQYVAYYFYLEATMDNYDKLEERIRNVMAELRKYSNEARALKEIHSSSDSGSFFAGENAAYERAIEFLERVLEGDR